jgi:hypothetical protein
VRKIVNPSLGAKVIQSKKYVENHPVGKLSGLSFPTAFEVSREGRLALAHGRSW